MNKTRTMDSIKNSLDKASKFISLEDKQNGRKKVYASLWAIFFGLLLASIVYMIIGRTGQSPQNTMPWTFIIYIFQGAIGKYIINDLLLLFLFFGFSGLAVAVSFKSGLFNIGVPGQMLLPAILFFAILFANKADLYHVDTGYIIGMFFVFIIVGMFMGAIPGILKAFFNVHEVISTIFLNWIVTYIAVWLFTGSNDVFFEKATHFDLYQTYFADIHGTQTYILSHALQKQFIIFGFILLLIVSFGLWFIYSKTTLGYKLKMVGINKSNAKYVGINEKLTIIGVMSLSGALAGISGFFYLVLKEKRIVADSTPIAIGFESIAIALIALNSPVGTLFSSVLYAFIYNSRGSFNLKNGSETIRPDFFNLITGLIIFMAALSIMFYKFKPLRSIIKYGYLITNKEYWLNFKLHHKSKMKYIFKERKKVTKAHIDEMKMRWNFHKDKIKYENEISDLIAKSKTYDDKELLEMYSLISEKKLLFEKIKSEKGFNIYYEMKNKYKVQLNSFKNQYNSTKEYLFTSAIKRNITNKFVSWVSKKSVKEEI